METDFLSLYFSRQFFESIVKKKDPAAIGDVCDQPPHANTALRKTRGQSSAEQLVAKRGQSSAEVVVNRGQSRAELAVNRGQPSAEVAGTRGLLSGEDTVTRGPLRQSLASEGASGKKSADKDKKEKRVARAAVETASRPPSGSPEDSSRRRRKPKVRVWERFKGTVSHFV